MVPGVAFDGKLAWSMAWPPEPFRWIGVTLSQNEMVRVDRNDGKRGLRLKLFERLNLGFACWLQRFVDAGEAFFSRFGNFQSTYRDAKARTRKPAECRIEQALNEQHESRGCGPARSLRSPLRGRVARG